MTARLCACGALVPALGGRGRPRVYCSDRCRWRAGHAAARGRRRAQEAAQEAEQVDWWATRQLGYLDGLPGPMAGVT